MKKNAQNRIKLGIFISLGTAVFLVGIYFIGEGQQLFRSTFRVSGVFRNVAGLQAGNNVRLSGINVGIVDNISIIGDSSIRVDVLIDESTRRFIKKDAVASIGSEGLMGNKVLIIHPGTGGKEVIEDNDVVVTSQPMTMDDILISLKTTIDHASSITSDLSKITDNIRSGEGTVGRLLMDNTLNQTLDATFANLKEGSARFRVLMEKGNEVDDILASLRSTAENAANITSDVSKITSNIESGKGTMGRLLMDPSWRLNFDTTLVNLKRSSGEFRSLIEKAKESWLLWSF